MNSVGDAFGWAFKDPAWLGKIAVQGLILIIPVVIGVLLSLHLAAGQITLLLGGIRNAWDMMIWIVIRAPTVDVGSRDDT